MDVRRATLSNDERFCDQGYAREAVSTRSVATGTSRANSIRLHPVAPAPGYCLAKLDVPVNRDPVATEVVSKVDDT